MGGVKIRRERREGKFIIFKALSFSATTGLTCSVEYLTTYCQGKKYISFKGYENEYSNFSPVFCLERLFLDRQDIGRTNGRTK